MRRRFRRLATSISEWQCSNPRQVLFARRIRSHDVKASPRNGLCIRRLALFFVLGFCVSPCESVVFSRQNAPIAKKFSDARLAKFSLHSNAVVERDSDASTGFPWARCSSDPSNPVIMSKDEECPSDCPYSQMVEGMTCEKLCVPGRLCAEFHPVLHFPDVRTMQCAPACGIGELQRIPGCAECMAPGICKRCSRGLFGITQLELSEDGTRCKNLSTKWWYLFYCFLGLLILLVVVYIGSLTLREPGHGSEANLAKAIVKRHIARKELTGAVKPKYRFRRVNNSAIQNADAADCADDVEKGAAGKTAEKSAAVDSQGNASEEEDSDVEVDLNNHEGAPVHCERARFGKGLSFYCQRCLGESTEVVGSLTVTVSSPIDFRKNDNAKKFKQSIRQAIADFAKMPKMRVQIPYVAVTHRSRETHDEKRLGLANLMGVHQTVNVEYKINIPVGSPVKDFTSSEAATASMRAAGETLASSLEREMKERGAEGFTVQRRNSKGPGIVASKVTCYGIDVKPAKKGFTGTCRAFKQCEACSTFQAEQDKEDLQFTETSFHDTVTASKRGGRGIVLYFNWLAFGMMVALVLACGHFISFELSDLGRHSQGGKQGAECLLRQARGAEKKGSLSTYITAEGDVLHHEKHEPNGHDVSSVEDTRETIVESMRDMARIIATEAEPTGSFAARYAQAHLRMFQSSIVAYILVVGLVFASYVYQLGIVITRYHNEEPHARGFAAVVTGLPKNFFNGKALTEYFRTLFAKGDEDLQKLWDTYGGDRRDEFEARTTITLRPGELDFEVDSTSHVTNFVRGGQADIKGVKVGWRGIEIGDQVFTMDGLREAARGEKDYQVTFAQEVSMKDRFWVVGTSIAFDFNLQQDSVNHEIDSWIEDLERESESKITPPILLEQGTSSASLSSRSIQRVSRDFPPDCQTPSNSADSYATDRGVQTESRGDILEQLRTEVPVHTHHPIFDESLLKFMGLEEEAETTLLGSGSAFVVFATEAARDAAVDISKNAERFCFPTPDKPIKLNVSPAHCEPVSIKWENFGPIEHFVVKGILCFVMIFFSMIVWIALSLPSAAFLADAAVIPGVSPGFVQNLLLGLLIAIGNQLIALVVEIVTDWMGFLYKDSRDVAVLGLAFVFTLSATIFDLLVVGVTAHGMVLENAFLGRDAGYEPVVANEIFFLTVPGYLVLPYLGMPIGERVLPYFLAFYLIRSHGKVTLRSAKKAMRSPEFDICWRYSDILNNTTICIVLLYFTSNKAWQVLFVLFLFLVIIYVIDKYTLCYAATPTVYDTHRLSNAFAFWWCLPTTMLAGLISYWGYRSGAISDNFVCVVIPILHVVVYLSALTIIEGVLQSRSHKQPVHYPEMMRRLVKAGKPWDYFNTNPVFCLRTRYLGADVTGWKEVVRFQQTEKSEGAVSQAQDSSEEKESDECVPFVRGSLRLLDPTLDKNLSAR